ncbi:dnaJ [Rosa sericea]
MANREEKGNDFYAVLGLKKECSDSELRNAYKKLALRWHPDRCSASGNSKFVEEAKKKFQDIQQAYSVLSDANKRFLYDVGAFESDDDENGMGDFLNEMAVMMSQTKPNEDGGESFEQLQELFEEMFQGDIESFSSCSQPPASCSTSSSSYASYCESSTPNNKRNSSEMNYGSATLDSSGFDAHFHSFCVGTGGKPARERDRDAGKKRDSRRSNQ